MNNNNNNNPNAAPPSRRNRKRARGGGPPAGQNPPKKQKTQGQQRRQRKRRNQRNGRAMSDRADRGGDYLAGRGPTNNFSGYGNKASMPVWEREYIAEIQPSAEPAFSLQQFPVNPGQAASFPWLANIAKNFEKYEFEYLRFIYKREVSEFATNGVTGKVIMSFDSDASDSAPTTKQQMLDTDPHADGMPCESFFMDIPKSILQKFNDAHFVRPGALPANTDLKTYDIGTLNVACQGTAANTVVGELHVEYALRLRVPVLELPVSSAAGTSPAYIGIGTLTAASPTVANPFNAGVPAGNIVVTQAGTTATFTGLTVGAEYAVSYGQNAVGASDQPSWGTNVGWTAKSTLYVDGELAIQTFTATATVATSVLTIAGNMTGATAALLTIVQIPTSTL